MWSRLSSTGRSFGQKINTNYQCAFKTKTRAFGTLLVGTGVTIGGVAYLYDAKDEERHKEAVTLYRKDQQRLKSKEFLQFTSVEDLVQTVEQLPTGHIPNPKNDAYTPSRSQELVVQGFTGGILTLFQHPEQHEALVDACGLALKRHLEDIEDVGERYQFDKELATAALSLPQETLENRAKDLGKTSEEYTSMLKDRLQHATEGVEASLVFRADIQHRLNIHVHIAERYPYAREALETLLKINPAELSKITNLPEKQCRNIIEAGIGSAMYGIGLITGQTVAGLSGQVIKGEHLDSIVNVAEKLGKHAIQLVSLSESLKDERLPIEKRVEITKKISEEYAQNKKSMRIDEFSLIVSSMFDNEYSQALAHTLAYAQGPEYLYGGANLARLFGGAVPLTATDILSLHSSSPHCIHDEHGIGDLVQVPGIIQRMKITATQGNQPWLIRENGQFDPTAVYRDAVARSEEEFPAVRCGYGGGD